MISDSEKLVSSNRSLIAEAFEAVDVEDCQYLEQGEVHLMLEALADRLNIARPTYSQCQDFYWHIRLGNDCRPILQEIIETFERDYDILQWKPF